MGSLLITINIPIKPYLKKFLRYYSINKEGPLRFPNKHDYNVLLWKLVTNYNSLKSIPVDDKQNVFEYFKSAKQDNDPNSVNIILPFNEKKDIRSYNYLSRDSKKKFRREVRIDFNFYFSRYLIKGLKEGKQRIVIVEEFMNKLKITEDDLKKESLYRYSSRLLEEI